MCVKQANKQATCLLILFVSDIGKVERTKHFLLLQESLQPDKTNEKARLRLVTNDNDNNDAIYCNHQSYTDNQKHLILKCIKLMNHGRQLKIYDDHKVAPIVNVRPRVDYSCQLYWFHAIWKYIFDSQIVKEEQEDEEEEEEELDQYQDELENDDYENRDQFFMHIPMASISSPIDHNRLKSMSKIKSSTSTTEMSR